MTQINSPENISVCNDYDANNKPQTLTLELSFQS